MKKKYIFLTILLLIIGGIFFAFMNLEAIVKKAVNKYGSEIVGTEVNLEGFGLDIMKGELKLTGLTVANPKGYNQPYLFSLDKVFVKLNIKSVMTDIIVVEEIKIDAPALTYEMISLTRNNILDVLNNLDKNTASTSPAKPKGAAVKEVKSDKPAKKVVIDKVSVNGTVLTAEVKVVNQSFDQSIILPNIVLKDIGKEGQAQSIKDTCVTIFKKILSEGLKSSGKALDDAKKMAKEFADKAVNQAKEELNKVKDQAKDNIKAEVDKAKDTLNNEKKNLLKGIGF